MRKIILNRRNWASLLVLVMVILAGCARPSSDATSPGAANKGRILLWHSWSGADKTVLEAMISGYTSLNPGTEVIAVAIEPSLLVDTFRTRSSSGLGPDLVLTDASLIYDLVQTGLVRDLAAGSSPDTSHFLSTALAAVSDSGHLYGLPFATHTPVLYYRRDRVDAPPIDVFQLQELAGRGETVALNVGFPASYWGIGAYDGRLIDGNGQLELGLGGFANWLDALQVARTMPGFLLSNQPDELRQAFVDGNAVFYVGDSSELPLLRELVGDGALGMSVLPAGPNGSPARPLLMVDALAFGSASSATEHALALDLAQYLTGTQEQFSLAMQDVGRLPANKNVRLTPNMPANVLVAARQSRTADAIPWEQGPLWQYLTDQSQSFATAYRQVVEGILSPNELVARSLAELSTRFGLAPRAVSAQDICPSTPAEITLWHALSDAEAGAFSEIAREFEEACPGTEVIQRRFDGDEIYDRYVEATIAGDGPSALHESSRWLPQLVSQGLIRDITELVAPEDLQQYQPRSVRAMRIDRKLYGIPESLVTLALYVNTDRVVDPPLDLDGLVQDVTSEDRWALPTGFWWGYWGMAPFGGLQYDPATGQIVDATGLVRWLDWLRSADDQPGVDLLDDWQVGEQAFAGGEAAYYVGGPWSLAAVGEALGSDGFSVTTLPNGPDAPGNPILQVTGTMISSQASAAETETAIAFARFLALPESQTVLLRTGSHVPSSITADLSAYPHIRGFREQAKAAALVDENEAFAAMESLGDELYRVVLVDGAEPALAVEAFVDQINTLAVPPAGQ